MDSNNGGIQGSAPAVLAQNVGRPNILHLVVGLDDVDWLCERDQSAEHEGQQVAFSFYVWPRASVWEHF